MAIDPRLMMSDFSGLARAGESIGQGIHGYKMNQINNLAGEALMLDPAAMEELKARSPQMAAQVHQQLQEQQAKQQQAAMDQRRAQFDEMKMFSEIRDKYGEKLARARNEQEAMKMHESWMRSDPLYAMLHEGDGEEEGLGAFGTDDFLAARAEYGSGYADMDIKDVRSAYANSPQVKTYLEVAPKFNEINDLLSRGTPAADNAALKILAKMVDSGVVTDSDFNQLANRNPDNAAAIGNLMDYVISGKVSDSARAALRQVGGDLFRHKEQGAIDLQTRMKENLGQHSADVVFDATGVFSGPTEIPEVEVPKEKPRARITAEQRGDELEASGMSDDEIVSTLRKEGYIK